MHIHTYIHRRTYTHTYRDMHTYIHTYLLTDSCVTATGPIINQARDLRQSSSSCRSSGLGLQLLGVAVGLGFRIYGFEFRVSGF